MSAPIVATFMTAPPITVPATATVREALAVLESLELRHLPVVDDAHPLIGVVSERDLHSLFAPRIELTVDAPLLARAALGRHVSQVMVKDPVAVESEAPLRVALDRMIQHHVGALPVLREGVVVGVLSWVDVARALRDGLTQG